MTLFLVGIVLLVIGYFTYGKLIERILAPDDRPTPAIAKADGVDFVTLPHWKNMLIQLLNIAGVGPVIGVILGIKFGTIVFLIIPLGNILGGAVHDYLAGMMSLRSGGANLPMIVRQNLGDTYYKFFNIFVMALLLLVVAVFINIPASLIDGFAPNTSLHWYAIGGIFLYYLIATFFPIDKIIGRIYPLFGLMLLLGTAAIFIAVFWKGLFDPSLLLESEAFKTNKSTDPIIPCLFVTIACGIMSGFHATQSPLVARTLTSEHQARSTFYGMMIVEGLIAMTWAGAGLAVYNSFPETIALPAPKVLGEITTHFLGAGLGIIPLIAIIILAITSGDTAMRSVRLCLAESLHIDQKKVVNRLVLCFVLGLFVIGLLVWSNTDKKSFALLWNYFAWGNQVLAASTLLTGFIWLHRQKKPVWIALLPGMFIMFVVLTYILWTSTEHHGPYGFGLSLSLSYGIAAALTLLIFGGAWIREKRGS